jgi:hypothetical protein
VEAASEVAAERWLFNSVCVLMESRIDASGVEAAVYRMSTCCLCSSSSQDPMALQAAMTSAVLVLDAAHEDCSRALLDQALLQHMQRSGLC